MLRFFLQLTRIMEDSATSSLKSLHQSGAAKAYHLNEKKIAGGRWINLNLITYRDAKGKERTWECASRTTTSSGQADAVMIMPLLRRTLHVDCLICVKQYRPPLRAYTIEFPAGLWDAGESAEACALRELKEETGYTASVKHVSPAVSLDGGTESCTIAIVTAEIDGDMPENKHPKQKLDESEAIEVITVPVNELLNRMNKFSAQGLVVDARVYNYAIGVAQFTKPPPQATPPEK